MPERSSGARFCFEAFRSLIQDLFGACIVYRILTDSVRGAGQLVGGEPGSAGGKIPD